MLILLWLSLAVIWVSGANKEEDTNYCRLDTDTELLPSDRSCRTEGTNPSTSVVSEIQRVHGKYPEQHVVPRSSKVHISIKTTSAYHKPRLSLLILTWLQTVAPEQVPRPHIWSTHL